MIEEKYDPTKENLICLICGKKIENWMTNSWFEVDGSGMSSCSSNIAQMMYHAKCWKNRHELGGVDCRKAVSRAYELLAPEQKQVADVIFEPWQSSRRKRVRA
jgi:hypothetical protein